MQCILILDVTVSILTFINLGLSGGKYIINPAVYPSICYHILDSDFVKEYLGKDPKRYRYEKIQTVILQESTVVKDMFRFLKFPTPSNKTLPVAVMTGRPSGQLSTLRLKGKIARIVPRSLRAVIFLKAQPRENVTKIISEPARPVRVKGGKVITMHRHSLRGLPPKERRPARLTPAPDNPLLYSLPALTLNEQDSDYRPLNSGSVELEQLSNRLSQRPVRTEYTIAELPTTTTTAITGQPGLRQGSRNRHTYNGPARVAIPAPAIRVTNPDGTPDNPNSWNSPPTHTVADCVDHTHRLEILFRHNAILAERNTCLEHLLEEARREVESWKDLYERDVRWSYIRETQTSGAQQHQKMPGGHCNDAEGLNRPSLYEDQFFEYETDEEEDYETEKNFEARIEFESSSRPFRSSRSPQIEQAAEGEQVVTLVDRTSQQTFYRHDDYPGSENDSVVNDANYDFTYHNSSSLLMLARQEKIAVLPDTEPVEEVPQAMNPPALAEYDDEEPQLHTATVTAIHSIRSYGATRIDISPPNFRGFDKEVALSETSERAASSSSPSLPEWMWNCDEHKWNSVPDLRLKDFPGLSVAPLNVNKAEKRRGGVFI
ncbi:hypothetical protein ACMFMG_005420 [Clarireedia jacksonii]